MGRSQLWVLACLTLGCATTPKSAPLPKCDITPGAIHVAFKCGAAEGVVIDAKGPVPIASAAYIESLETKLPDGDRIVSRPVKTDGSRAINQAVEIALSTADVDGVVPFAFVLALGITREQTRLVVCGLPRAPAPGLPQCLAALDSLEAKDFTTDKVDILGHTVKLPADCKVSSMTDKSGELRCSQGVFAWRRLEGPFDLRRLDYMARALRGNLPLEAEYGTVCRVFSKKAACYLLRIGGKEPTAFIVAATGLENDTMMLQCAYGPEDGPPDICRKAIRVPPPETDEEPPSRMPDVEPSDPVRSSTTSA